MTTRLRAATTSLATVALLALGATLIPSAAASAQSASSGSAGGQGQLPGVNDFECESPQHPRPVVLVHGTDMSMEETWGPLAAELKRDDYCVFALNYGGIPTFNLDTLTLGPGWGTAPIQDSAKQLDKFIEEVRTGTQSSQVDVVGHSQGGTMTRQYLRFLGGASGNKVHTLAMLGPSTHGTDFGGRYLTEADAKAKGEPVAAQQQILGSKFLTELNAGNQETLPGIDYTVIATNTDNVITPNPTPANPTNLSFLNPAPGTEGSVHNWTVQDRCQDPGLAIFHADELSPDKHPEGLLNHPAPLFLVRQALDPTLVGTPPC